MKKYLIGLLSIALLMASFLGASSKGPRCRRSERSSDPAMWV